MDGKMQRILNNGRIRAAADTFLDDYGMHFVTILDPSTKNIEILVGIMWSYGDLANLSILADGSLLIASL